MIDENELLDAMDECEKAPLTAAKCEKLACLYVIYDHLFGVKNAQKKTANKATPFFEAISDKDILQVLDVIDELMDGLSVIQPKLYEAFLTKISNI